VLEGKRREGKGRAHSSFSGLTVPLPFFLSPYVLPSGPQLLASSLRGRALYRFTFTAHPEGRTEEQGYMALYILEERVGLIYGHPIMRKKERGCKGQVPQLL
jgi:hypothetical protein